MAVDEPRHVVLPPMRDARARDVLGRACTTPDGLPPVALAGRAALLASPLIVLGETVAGRRRLARAVHAVGGRSGPLVVGPGAGECIGDASSTLLLEVDAMGPDVEALVECLVDDGDPWLLIGARTVADVPTALRRWGVGPTLEVPSLDDETIATVAQATLRALGAPAGEAPVLDPDAVAWLVGCPEARDADALRWLLRRALLVAAPGAPIGVQHLAPPLPGSPSGVDVASQSFAAATASPAADRLEYVLAELAHELRNPLVTLKTVADHLDDLAADEELRGRFGELASEAVARMDDLLDNLVTYGRLGTPTPRPVELVDLLAAAVREAEPALADRRLRVRPPAGSAACVSDPAHLGFALKNLLVGIAQTATPGGEVLVDANMNGVVRLRFTADADAATLQSLLAPSATHALYDPTFQPLPFSLARAVLETVGGRVDVAPTTEGRTALELHLPVPSAPG